MRLARVHAAEVADVAAADRSESVEDFAVEAGMGMPNR
jgi:hypothetical protein